MSIYGIAKGVSLIFFLLSARLVEGISIPPDRPLQRITFSYSDDDSEVKEPSFSSYRLLVTVKEGDFFQAKKIRQSIENLYKTGEFSNIEGSVSFSQDESVILRFVLERKKRIRLVRYRIDDGISQREVEKNVFSLKKGDYFQTSLAEQAVLEIRRTLEARGFVQSEVFFNMKPVPKTIWADLDFTVKCGKRLKIRSMYVDVDVPKMKNRIEAEFRRLSWFSQVDIQKISQKSGQILKKYNFFYPEIRIQEVWRDRQTQKVDLQVSVSCGYQYHFRFLGIRPKMDLIRSVWQKKVFEKWAESESRARLLNYLKDRGFWNVQVQSDVVVRDRNKYVIFTLIKDRRYTMGNISFSGNRVFPDETLASVIKAKDLMFDQIFWLRAGSLIRDLQALQLLYQSKGYADVAISIIPHFRKGIADIEFSIRENQPQAISALHFSGNAHFSGEALANLLESKVGNPFIEKKFLGDIDRLQAFYWSRGFYHARIDYSMSDSHDRRIDIRIEEGELQTMGECIIIGGSLEQKRLLQARFPMGKGVPFSREKLVQFQQEMEKSALFSELHIEMIPISSQVNNVLIRVTPDRSRFYGFAFGAVGRKEIGLRGTAEFQEKNIFNLASTLSAMIQLTIPNFKEIVPGERRGILSLDTPFFLHRQLHSQFQIWEENEIYPAYRFRRWGIGASFIKYFSEKLYAIAALKWYRTSLTELNIPPFGVDQLRVPFDTTAFSLTLARESRDDPFNPTRGDFISSDLKIGLPIFEKNYTFLKFFWNYQFHRPFLENGVFSFSLKNGLAFGDMSITERFFAGGAHSFRGTRNDRLGPIHSLTNSPQGGDILLLLNLEATFPLLIVPIPDLYYTFFLDVGNIFEKSSQLDFMKMERAIGLGVKYRTPIGPIRLEIAWNLRGSGRDYLLVQFGIGNVY